MSAWDHVQITCCVCGATIALHSQHHAQLKESHDTFYCANGHSQYFHGKSEKEKQVKQLERRVAFLDRDVEHWIAAKDACHAGLLAVNVCPFGCGYHSTRRVPWIPSESDVTRFLDRAWSDLREHLVSDHGATPPGLKQIPERTGDAA